MKLGDIAAAVGKGLFAGAASPPLCHSQARSFAHRNGLGREEAKAGQKLTSAATLYAVRGLELWHSSYALIPPTSRIREDE